MSDVEQQAQQEIIEIITTTLLPATSLSIFKERLAAYLHELINHDFEKLVNLLYRLDVSEKKLKDLLNSSRGEDAGLLIAQMIIDRQLEKIKTRGQYQQRDKNISDEEKW
jgi:hypothetical protein